MRNYRVRHERIAGGEVSTVVYADLGRIGAWLLALWLFVFWLRPLDAVYVEYRSEASS